MYVYQADLYCDRCGEEIAALLTKEGHKESDESDFWPIYAVSSEADSPTHCASGDLCPDAIDGVAPIIEDDLTSDGIEYVDQAILDDLWRLWTDPSAVPGVALTVWAPHWERGDDFRDQLADLVGDYVCRRMQPALVK